MINNPKAARIVAIVVIAMLVITLAASLFGCSADKKTASGDRRSDQRSQVRRRGGPAEGGAGRR